MSMYTSGILEPTPIGILIGIGMGSASSVTFQGHDCNILEILICRTSITVLPPLILEAYKVYTNKATATVEDAWIYNMNNLGT